MDTLKSDPRLSGEALPPAHSWLPVEEKKKVDEDELRTVVGYGADSQV